MGGIKIDQLKQRSIKVQEPEKNKSGFSVTSLLDKEITLFPTRFTDKVKESFYLELGTLLASGLDIRSALELIETEQEKPAYAAIIRLLKDELVGGKSLSEAMQEAKQFTPYEYYAVQIGEETGKLIVVLEQLTQFYASRLKQRRQLVGALSYPIIILITSIGAVSFMLVFIVPMFRDVFKRFGGELPGLTKMIIGFSEALQANILWIIVIVLIVSISLYVNRDKIWMRQFAAKALKRIPVVGKIVYSLQLARFCTSMSLLLGSRVPMLRALRLIHQMVTFYPIQTTLPLIEDSILHGETLHSAMGKFSVYNRKMVSLVKVGEEVNKLDVFFERLGRQYTTDAEHQTGLLNTFLEPAMIIFLGLVVGFILLAMYLPMFEMSTSIGG
ncbi:MAG: type II secretion system F family protein [Cyclobacteriaceae bacterium]|nr:type II secretion system F family protein [Cyclobacteriaceae bacterium]